MSVDYRIGDTRALCAALPDSSVDLVACSPPFLGLRNYGTQSTDEIGSETCPAEFLAVMLDLAVGWRRVLSPTGSIAIELGDSYSGSGGAGGDYNSGGLRDGQAKFSGTAAKGRRDRRADMANGILPEESNYGRGWPLPKSLCGIPTLFAWSLAYGWNMLAPPGSGSPFERTIEPWRVRNIIVWARNNPPVGALGDKVRPATSYIVVATPSAKRWFDLDAVRTAPKNGAIAGSVGGSTNGYRGITEGGGRAGHNLISDPAGAPPLDHWHDEYDGDLTWLVNTAGTSLAHYATWPAKLAERIVLSMCPLWVCRTCGEPSRRITKTVNALGKAVNHSAHRVGMEGRTFADKNKDAPRFADVQTLGWSCCCCGDGCTPAVTMTETIPAHHNSDGRLITNERTITTTLESASCDGTHLRPGVTLDPFAGTGTTLAVAEHHGRDAIGFDLDPRNKANLWPLRRAEVFRSLGLNIPKVNDAQLDLFDATEEVA